MIEHTPGRLRRLLREAAEPAFRATQQSFSKEPIRTLGVRTPQVRRLATQAAKEYREARLPWEKIVTIAEELWRGKMLEERVLGIEILARFRSRLDDWRRFDGWVDTLSNWGETDGLCIYVLAPILERQPEAARRLLAWTRSRNRWRRRAAAAALVPLARRGQHLGIAAEVCRRLAADRDDLVRKAVVWLRKQTARSRILEQPSGGRL